MKDIIKVLVLGGQRLGAQKNNKVRGQARKLYKELLKKGYNKPEAIKLIASQFNRKESTIRTWHSRYNWKTIDEEYEQKLIEDAEELEKQAPDKKRQQKRLFHIINHILFDTYKRTSSDALVNNFYDLYYLIDAYLRLASTSDPRIQPHRKFLVNVINSVLKDKEKYEKILPTKARPLSFAIKNLADYMLLSSEKGDIEAEEKEEEPLTEREYILMLLKQIEEEEKIEEKG